MGKRRIRNLLFHGISPAKIFGFDTSQERCREANEKYSIRASTDFRKTYTEINPDVIIVSTPPDQHHSYFLRAARNKKHFFVEHPTTDVGYNQLLKLLGGTSVGVPSCSWRFHPAVKKIRQIINFGRIGDVLSFQYHMGQYLPDWHPWEDYRKVYFSKKDTGACREMFAFELGWLTYALDLGEVKKICGITKKISALDMPADDAYFAILEFNNGAVGSIAIDLLSRKPFRTLRVIGSCGVLEWEWLDHKIKLYQASGKRQKIINLKGGRSEKNYITTEDMYEEEIGHFLGAINGGKKYPFTFAENLRFLKALFALEKSAKTGKQTVLE